jgi:hypothetical protein
MIPYQGTVEKRSRRSTARDRLAYVNVMATPWVAQAMTVDDRIHVARKFLSNFPSPMAKAIVLTEPSKPLRPSTVQR